MDDRRVERWNIDHPLWGKYWPDEKAALLRERKRREDDGIESGAAAERYWLERIRRRAESQTAEKE